MKKLMLALVPLGVGLASMACAQETTLPSTALMKEQQQALYRDLSSMMKGEAPFSAERAQRNITHLIETSQKIPAAFPESLKGRVTPESRYAASPKVWEQRAEFEAKAAFLLKELKATEASFQTLDGLKVAYPRVNEACNGCHEVFRVRR
jgi:cytochrome c556